MSDLVRMHDPLMQPVVYNGQEYFTSQYFHRQYVASSEQEGKAGKYRRHDSFMRLLRSIEAYSRYVEKGDIVELRWIPRRDHPTTDQVLVQQIKKLEPLFAAQGYRSLPLLNATAQAAMSHHLDDELSQEISVTVNTMAARESQRATLPQDPMAHLKSMIEVAQAQFVALQAVQHRQDAADHRMEQIEQQHKLLAPHDYSDGLMTVVGYAQTKGYKLTTRQLNLSGQLLARIAKREHIETGSLPDSRWGSVKTYPLAFLDQYFPTVLPLIREV